MSIEVSTTEEGSGFLTREELKQGKIYLSTSPGSKGFLFVKLGSPYDNSDVFAFNTDTTIRASTSHGRDFYLAPKGTYITIKND